MAKGSDKILIKQANLLIVEGNDEREFFGAILDYLEKGRSLHLDVQILVAGGKTNILPLLEGLKKIEGYLNSQVKKIGVVADYDDKTQDMFARVCNALEKGGFTKPSKPLELSDGDPQTVICMMPPAEEGTGQMLEDLLWGYFEEKSDPYLACIDGYIECLGTLPSEPIPTNRIPKAKFYALIGAKETPITADKVYLAYKTHIKDWESPVFQPIITFLRQLGELT